jgi:cellulose synthase/poly-beta-1,6-N-acetylglucosamine synthase-like glycosyltransferase
LELLSPVTVGVALAAVGIDLAFWFRALRGYRRWSSSERSRPEPRSWPNVHVIVCLKGSLPRLRETVRALRDQDYRGTYRITFVTEAAAEDGDLAAGDLRAVLDTDADARERCDHVVAGRVIDRGLRRAQKNQNLLAGIRHAEEGFGPIDVFAFCDGDLLVRTHWLRDMVRPLATGAGDASTSFHGVAPTEGRILEALHGLAEASQSLATLVCRGATWGGSMAIRAEAFRRLRLAEVWGRTVVDDTSMIRVVKEKGLRVVPVPRLLVSSTSTIPNYRRFVGWLGRQFFFVKVYLPWRYRILWTKIGLNVALLWLAGFHAGYRLIEGAWPSGPWAGWSALIAAAVVLASCDVCRFLVPDRSPARIAIPASFLMHGAGLLACANASLRRHRLTWSDLTYVLERDGRVADVSSSAMEPIPPVADEVAPEEAAA